MKKGKSFLLVSGIFDIIFALGLFTLIALSFFQINYISQLVFSVFSIVSVIIGNPLPYIEIINYSTLGLLGLIGLLSLIFGSVSIARVRKDQKGYYYKGGRLIGYVIIETIILAFLAFLLSRLFIFPIMTILPSIAIVSLLALIVLFRYISLGMFYCGKKKYIESTPIA